MTKEEAEEYAKTMTYRDAIYNLTHAKCIPYRKATFIKVYELLDILDKIRAEIEKERDAFGKWDESDRWYAYDECLDIIDRYIGENEEETSKKILTAMKESAEAVKNSPKYDFSCVTSLFDKDEE